MLRSSLRAAGALARRCAAGMGAVRRVGVALGGLAVAAATLLAQQDSVGALAAPHTALESRTVIEVDSLDRAAFANVAELLQARVPGLHISRTGDGGMRWFMRGPSSVSESVPLVLIDGMRLNVASSSLRETGTRPPVLDEIDIEDVQRIEVWSGPATAAHYGTGAAHGVIRVVTFAPGAQPITFRLSAATGLIDDDVTYPANFNRTGVSSGGSPVRHCTLQQEARGGCIPTEALTSVNVLESDSPFETALATRVAGMIAAGTERVTVRGGATFDRQGSPTGALANQRLHVRGAGSVRASQHLDVTVRGHWVHGVAELPSLDEPSLLEQGLFARADTAWMGFIVPPTSDYKSDRYGGIVTGVWRPRGWLDVRLTSGLERLVDEDDLEYVIEDNPVGPLSIDMRGERRRRDLTVRLDADSRYGGAWLRHTTAATIERAVSRQEDESREFRQSGGSVFQRSFWLNVRTGITGLGLTHRLHLGQRATLTGGVRLDRLKLGDVRWDVPFLPHVSFSWDARAFAPRTLGGIRLRGALGNAASSPQLSWFFFPIGPPGSERPKAEVTRERELGIDVLGARDRVALSATWYTKRTSDIPQLLTGPFFQFGRLEVLNRGIEASVRARILRTPQLTWDARVWYAHNHNEVTRNELSPHVIGSGQIFIPHRQWVITGQPLAAHRTSTIVSIRDLDNDGLLDTVCDEGVADCEVTVRPATGFRPAFPPTTASFGTSVRYRALTFSALVDHRSGHAAHNLPLQLRCFTVCQGLYDPTTSVHEQAEALLAGDAEVFVEDASYTKVREVSLRVAAPASWASTFGASRLELTLAGRNVATWTDYRGLDPESTSFPWVPLAYVDNAATPVPRRFLVRVDLHGR